MDCDYNKCYRLDMQCRVLRVAEVVELVDTQR